MLFWLLLFVFRLFPLPWTLQLSLSSSPSSHRSQFFFPPISRCSLVDTHRSIASLVSSLLSSQSSVSFPLCYRSSVSFGFVVVSYYKNPLKHQKKKKQRRLALYILIVPSAFLAFSIPFLAKFVADMSRTETHDFEYPPGLGLARNSANDIHGFPLAPTYTLSDRRPSVTMAGYSVYTPQTRGDRDYTFGVADNGSWPMSVPNRHTPAISTQQQQQQHLSSLNYNHNNLHRSSPSQPHPTAIYQSPIYSDRDSNLLRQNNHPAPPPPTATSNYNSSRSTIWWGELEPWMDEEYAKQVCGIMGWDPVNVKVPHPAPDPATGQQPNNPGYCFLTFPTPAHAASVLAQINNGGNAAPVTMPNSSKPFVLNWASSVPSSTPLPTAFSAADGAMPAAQQPYPKEYSIFVGDLAPETSNSDLVAVFRNPVLGLRNDREPKFIRPFLSCKSAKIMLDPVTGVSRGYGFVR